MEIYVGKLPYMPKPIVAIDATLAFGTNTGDSTYWTNLIQALEGEDREIELVLLSSGRKPSGVKSRWLEVGRASRWNSLVGMPMAARRAGAKAYHTQYTLSPLARGGITTIHDVSFFIGPEWFKPKDRILMQKTVPASARRARKVITVSETSKRDVARFTNVPEKKIVVTYNAAPGWFRPPAGDNQIPIDAPYLLAIGARWPRKNLALAIAAAERLPERFPHKLLVVGKEGWGEEGGGKRTVATGYLPNEALPALYGAADLFLFPSFYEGFGIPMVEAFACGTPVLASSGGSLPEVSGGAAEIIDSFEPDVWTAAITRLLDDSSKLAQMRQRGFARSKDFSWEKTANITSDVYREVVHGG